MPIRATSGAHAGRETALRKTPAVWDSTNVRRRAVNMALHAAATTAAAIIPMPNIATMDSITCIERQSVHAVDELVEGCMCHILDSR